MKQQKPGSNKRLNIVNKGIAAFLLGAAILVYGCENNIEQIKAFVSDENLPLVEAENFETMLTDSGVIRYFLKAPRLLKFNLDGKEFVEFPDGMELIQYDANRKVISSLKSDYAKQFVKEQRWEAKNNVIATNLEGDTLKTEHLIWEEKDKQVYTDEFVEIVRADGIYTGIGLTADESLDNWRIKKLKGIVYVSVDENNRAPSPKPEMGRVGRPFENPDPLKK